MPKIIYANLKGIAIPPVSFVDWSKVIFSRPKNFVASRRGN